MMRKNRKNEMFIKFNNENIERMDCIIAILKRLMEYKESGINVKINKNGKFYAEVCYNENSKKVLEEKDFNRIGITDMYLDDGNNNYANQRFWKVFECEHYEMNEPEIILANI